MGVVFLPPRSPASPHSCDVCTLSHAPISKSLKKNILWFLPNLPLSRSVSVACVDFRVLCYCRTLRTRPRTAPTNSSDDTKVCVSGGLNPTAFLPSRVRIWIVLGGCVGGFLQISLERLGCCPEPRRGTDLGSLCEVNFSFFSKTYLFIRERGRGSAPLGEQQAENQNQSWGVRQAPWGADSGFELRTLRP